MRNIVYCIIVPYFFSSFIYYFHGEMKCRLFFFPHANKPRKLKWAGECGSLCYDLSALFFHGYSPCLAADFVLPVRPSMRLRALRLPTGWLRLGVLTANKMLTLVLPLSFLGSKGKWIEVVLYRKSGVFFFFNGKKRKFLLSTETEWMWYF